VSNATSTNAQAATGTHANEWTALYRELLTQYTHDQLCDAYGLHRDDVEGGTHWTAVVAQAVAHGDIDLDTMELT